MQEKRKEEPIVSEVTGRLGDAINEVGEAKVVNLLRLSRQNPNASPEQLAALLLQSKIA